MPDDDVIVTVTFKLKDGFHTITVNDATNGTVTVNDNKTAEKAGENVTLTVTPDANYKLDTLTVDGKDVTSAVADGKYTFAMPDADVTVSATFKLAGHAITIAATEHGMVTCDTVAEGGHS